MISPEAIAKQRDVSAGGGFSSEGVTPALAPPRGKERFKVVVLLAAVIFGGCQAWKYHMKEAPAVSVVAPARFPETRPIVAERKEREEPKQRVAVDWVLDGRCGLRIDGESYIAFTGDNIDGVAVGMLGGRWVDLQVRGVTRRLYISSSGASGSRSRGGSAARGGGSTVFGQAGSGARPTSN